MKAFLYELFLQFRLDIRSKALLLTCYVVPLFFFALMGGIFTAVDPAPALRSFPPCPCLSSRWGRSSACRRSCRRFTAGRSKRCTARAAYRCIRERSPAFCPPFSICRSSVSSSVPSRPRHSARRCPKICRGISGCWRSSSPLLSRSAVYSGCSANRRRSWRCTRNWYFCLRSCFRGSCSPRPCCPIFCNMRACCFPRPSPSAR